MRPFSLNFQGKGVNPNAVPARRHHSNIRQSKSWVPPETVTNFPSHVRSSSSMDNGSTSDLPSKSGFWDSATVSNPSTADLARMSCSAGPSEQDLVHNAHVIAEGCGLLQNYRRRRCRIWWNQPKGPESILIIKKPNNLEASSKLREIADWLLQRGRRVLVEDTVLSQYPDLEALGPSLREVDLCITLGGDGTVLHTASLFSQDSPLPPVLSFAMGSLGFLTPFDANLFALHLTNILDSNSESHPVHCTLRSRMCCELFWEGRKQRNFNILNEVVIDRGAYPQALELECSIDGWQTTVRADGLILSTPSGSTAYSMSSGGPIVAPSVPCVVITPVAPHSLSFRPIVIPETALIEITLPMSSKANGRVSFDGRGSMRLLRGSTIRAQTAFCPLPQVTAAGKDTDWYEGIREKLHWNQQLR